MGTTSRKFLTITLPPPRTTPKASAAAEDFAFLVPAPATAAAPSTATLSPTTIANKARPIQRKRKRVPRTELEGQIQELRRQLEASQVEASLCREYRAKRAAALHEVKAVQAQNAQLLQQIGTLQAEDVKKAHKLMKLRHELASTSHQRWRVANSLARTNQQVSDLEQHKADGEAEHLPMVGFVAVSASAAGGLGPAHAGGAGGGGSSAAARAPGTHPMRLVIDSTEESPLSLDEEEAAGDAKMKEGDAEGRVRDRALN